MNLFSVSTVALALVISVPARAPREWVKEKDQINGRISRTQLTKMQRTAGDMVAFLHDSCFSDIDFSPIWHGEYSSGKFGIQCRTADNKSQLTIMANDFSPLLRYLTVNGKEIAGIRPVAGIQDDCRYFEYENEDQVRTITWLVTNKREQLPYIEISRKEYLQEARAELNKIKDGIIADVRLKTPVRGTAIQEAEKKASIDELSSHYAGTDLQVRMRLFIQNYQSDEAYLQDAIHTATARLDKTLRLMDSLALRSTAVELNKPAIVSVEAIDFRGFEDNAGDRNMLVRMNPTYFNANLSGERAQLFLVSWSYDPADAGAVGIDRAIRENMDFGQLQDMLGK